MTARGGKAKHRVAHIDGERLARRRLAAFPPQASAIREEQESSPGGRAMVTWQEGTTRVPQRSTATVLVFTAAVFLSASLLFSVQPLFAKVVLPLLGGAPAVWTTAMLFFQAVLIGGYLYAHLLTKYVPLRGQITVHVALWGVALLTLPIGLPEGWRVDPSGAVQWQTLLLFAVGVGAPYALLSANAPLIQSWYARTGGPSADDPYFLYGASNAGSLLSLLAVPLVAEPFFGTTSTIAAWTAGFALFGPLLILSALRCRPQTVEPIAVPERRETISASRCARWLLVAFVPASLMLAMTTKVSTDLGSLPLVWAVPLAIYILTFVLTFTNRPVLSDAMVDRLFVPGLLGATISMSRFLFAAFTVFDAVIAAISLFAIAMKAHRTLYLSRPDTSGLTTFYVAMSVGGALGGFFNSILAPLLFTGLYEVPLTILIAGAVLMPQRDRMNVSGIGRAVALALLAFLLASQKGEWLLPTTVADIAAVAVLLVPVAFGWPLWSTGMILLFVAGELVHDAGAQTLHRDRSFFATHIVRQESGFHIYSNGTTLHGIQIADEGGARPTPQSYYHPSGPMARLATASALPANASIGVVGLGVGSLACYAKPDQSWEFYEIDPAVVAIARDRRLFTFLSECAPDAPVLLGDARLRLEDEGPAYDLLIIDAYSSDAVPLHLLTREAFSIYASRLAEDGVLVLHLSNRYYDLTAPVARLARDAGFAARLEQHHPGDDVKGYATASTVIALSRSIERLQAITPDSGWENLVADEGAAWTDDRASLLSALRRR